MQFTKDIYQILITQNRFILSAVILLFSFFFTKVSIDLFLYVFHIKKSEKEKLIYIFVTSLLLVVSRLYLPIYYSRIINLFIVFSCMLGLLKVHPLNSLLAICMQLVIIVFNETLFSRTFCIIYNLPSSLEGMTIPIYRMSMFLSIIFTTLIVHAILEKHNFHISLNENITPKQKNIIIAVSILGLIIMFSHILVVIYYGAQIPFGIFVLNSIAILFYFYISISNVLKIDIIEKDTLKIENLEFYNQTLATMNDSVRAFKHDFNNIMQAIGGYIKLGNVEALKSYYNELMKDCNQINCLGALDPAVINSPAVYHLLSSKYTVANQLLIKMQISSFLNFGQIHMKEYEFTRVMGILLDNAIEAAKESEEKEIKIEFTFDKLKNRELMIIENTYCEKDINLDKIYEKGFSTKKKNTGLGLWEVRQILNRNQNLNLHTTKNDKTFKQQLEIYIAS